MKTKSQNPFTTNVLALVAKVLGKKYDVNITIGGYGTASTDGHTIHLPAVSGEYAEALARGYIDHESFHIRLTDMNIMPTADFAGALLNVIEDIRIEKSGGKDYPGCASNLKALSEVLVKKHGALQPNPVNPSSNILSWVSTRGYVDILGHESMRESAENVEPMARLIFGKHFAAAQQLVAKIDTLPEDKTGTRQAVALRDEFMKLIKDAKQDADAAEKEKAEKEKAEKEKRENADSGKAGEGEKGDSDKVEPGADQPDKAEEEEPKEPGQPERGDDKKDKDNNGEGGGEGEEEGQEEDGAENGGGPGEKSTAGPAADDSGTGDGQGNGTGQGEGNSPSGADSQKPGTAKGNGNSDNDGGDSTGRENSGESSAAGTGDSDGIGEAVKEAVMAALREALGTDQVEFADIGELLEELLDKAAKAEKTPAASIPKLLTCEIHPLVSAIEFPDLTHVRSHTAKLRAQLNGLIQASKLKRSLPAREGRKLDNRVLSRIRVGDDRLFSRRDEKKAVNTAVIHLLDGSSSLGYNQPGEKMFVATRSCFVALEALYAIPGVQSAAVEFNDSEYHVYPLCGWGEKPDSRKFNHNSTGGTCLGHALWYAWGELRLRPEPRKICIIYSDGETSDRADTHAAIKRMKAEGMELVGIGIKDKSLLIYLPQETRVITDLSELTPALLELLRKKLTEKAAA